MELEIYFHFAAQEFSLIILKVKLLISKLSTATYPKVLFFSAWIYSINFELKRLNAFLPRWDSELWTVDETFFN